MNAHANAMTNSDWRIKLDPYAINQVYDDTIYLLKIKALPFVIAFVISLIILNFLEFDLIANMLIMILLITSAIVQTLVTDMKSNSNKNMSDRLLIRLEITKMSVAAHNYLLMLKTMVLVIQHYLMNTILLIQINKNKVKMRFEQVLLRLELDTNQQNISLGRRINIE